jgi:adenylyl- and sulfurtransferase ThiI
MHNYYALDNIMRIACMHAELARAECLIVTGEHIIQVAIAKG